LVLGDCGWGKDGHHEGEYGAFVSLLRAMPPTLIPAHRQHHLSWRCRDGYIDYMNCLDRITINSEQCGGRP